jgi:hypothetical protein
LTIFYVMTPGVGFRVSCLIDPEDSLGLMLNPVSVWRRLASVCQYRVAWCPKHFILIGILNLRHDDIRRDAQRRFANIVSCGFPRLMYMKYGMFSRASRHSASVCQCLAVWLLCSHGRYGILSWRLFANVGVCGFLRLMYAIYGILCRRRDDRHLDAYRRFVNIVSLDVSRLFLARFSI